jgi:hypothetical protein
MKELVTKDGKKVMVDDDVHEHYKNESLNWCHNAVRLRFQGVSLARVILGVEEHLVPDHKDGNPLNCQRDNLRIATRQQNSCNQKIRSTNTSGYKGVSWHSRRYKWQAYIMVNYKRVYLGLFGTAEDAAKAYNEKAKELHGEFARLNEV